MELTLTNIAYIHIDSRWKNNSTENQIMSYYSDIRDILQATTNIVPPTIQLEYTHSLALMQTKAAFKIPGSLLDPNIQFDTEGNLCR